MDRAEKTNARLSASQTLILDIQHQTVEQIGQLKRLDEQMQQLNGMLNKQQKELDHVRASTKSSSGNTMVAMVAQIVLLILVVMVLLMVRNLAN